MEETMALNKADYEKLHTEFLQLIEAVGVEQIDEWLMKDAQRLSGHYVPLKCGACGLGTMIPVVRYLKHCDKCGYEF